MRRDGIALIDEALTDGDHPRRIGQAGDMDAVALRAHDGDRVGDDDILIIHRLHDEAPVGGQRQGGGREEMRQGLFGGDTHLCADPRRYRAVGIVHRDLRGKGPRARIGSRADEADHPARRLTSDEPHFGLHAGADAAQHLLRHLDLDTQRIEVDQAPNRLTGRDEFTRLDIEIIEPPVETGADCCMALGAAGRNQCRFSSRPRGTRVDDAVEGAASAVEQRLRLTELTLGAFQLGLRLGSGRSALRIIETGDDGAFADTVTALRFERNDLAGHLGAQDRIAHRQGLAFGDEDLLHRLRLRFAYRDGDGRNRLIAHDLLFLLGGKDEARSHPQNKRDHDAGRDPGRVISARGTGDLRLVCLRTRFFRGGLCQGDISGCAVCLWVAGYREEVRHARFSRKPRKIRARRLKVPGLRRSSLRVYGGTGPSS